MTPDLARRLAALAYQDEETVRRRCADLRQADPLPFAASGTEGFVCVNQPRGAEPEAVVVFRGTMVEWVPLTPADVLTRRVVSKIRAALADVFSDANVLKVKWGGPGLVHYGARVALGFVWRQVRSAVHERGCSRVVAVGHSLGGLLAQQFAGRWLEGRNRPRVGVTTFGCPGCGSSRFARYVADRCLWNENWWYCSDLVPRLLSSRLGYFVPGRENYVDRRGRLRYKTTVSGRLADRTLARAANWARLVWDQDIAHHSINHRVWESGVLPAVNAFRVSDEIAGGVRSEK